MIEAFILIAALCLVAALLRPLIEWVKYIELKRAIDRTEAEWQRRMLEQAQFRYSSQFALSRPSAHAIITGITS